MTLKAAITALTAAAAALVLAACGSSTTAKGVMLAPEGGPTTTTYAATLTAATPKSGPLSKQPVIKLPPGPPPTHLVKKDLITGTGATAKAGDQVAVNYVGELYKGGTVFDSSWKDTPGKAFTATLGTGGSNSVIAGWIKGIPGMKAGGRRELIIPPSLAYGNQANGKIPKDATLVFVIDLLKVGK